MIGCFNKSTILTYIGISFSLFGMFNLFITNNLDSVNRLDIAIICLILAGICDLFDGFIARKCKRNETQKQFGVQIDSLCDVISFLVYPAILLYFMCKESNFLYVLVMIFYVVCGITRLAWFNMHTEIFKDHFQGLPVTYSAIIIPCLYTIFNITNPIFKIIIPCIYCLLGLFFVLNIRIPKPKGIFYPFFAILAIGMIVWILV